jgi:hypothetical protein
MLIPNTPRRRQADSPARRGLADAGACSEPCKREGIDPPGRAAEIPLGQKAPPPRRGRPARQRTTVCHNPEEAAPRRCATSCSPSSAMPSLAPTPSPPPSGSASPASSAPSPATGGSSGAPRPACCASTGRRWPPRPTSTASSCCAPPTPRCRPRTSPSATSSCSKVKRAWRDMKSTLELRPVYHRLEERIRAHVILCSRAEAVPRPVDLVADPPRTPRRHFTAPVFQRCRSAATFMPTGLPQLRNSGLESVPNPGLATHEVPE